MFAGKEESGFPVSVGRAGQDETSLGGRRNDSGREPHHITEDNQMVMGSGFESSLLPHASRTAK